MNGIADHRPRSYWSKSTLVLFAEGSKEDYYDEDNVFTKEISPGVVVRCVQMHVVSDGNSAVFDLAA
jgi:hypothetical protein